MILFSHEQILIFVVMAKSFFNIRQKFFKVDDLGWSSTVEEAEGRVVNKDGSFNLIRKGEKYHLYHLLISMTWPQFVLLIFVAFTLINGIFAFLYYFLGAENLSGFVSKGFVLDIINLFHFSVQTITTVGYGAMHPIGIATGVIASVEALIGLMSFALIAGLMYGRFSNPKAELKYAKHMVMTNVDGKPTLQARVANKLSHDLFDIRARILMLHNEKNSEGVMLKRYNTLKLQIDNISFLPMNWTITHFIDKDSPLNGLSKEDLIARKVEFLVLITAFDDSFSQLVHSRSSFLCEDLLFEEQWAKTYFVNEKGQRVFDLDRLDMLKDKNVQE
jgi:inward rectifier potassium channel